MSSKRRHSLLCELGDGMTVKIVIRNKKKKELTLNNVVKDYPKVTKILSIEELDKPAPYSPATYHDLMDRKDLYNVERKNRNVKVLK